MCIGPLIIRQQSCQGTTHVSVLFSQVTGPIGVVFTPETMNRYLMLFNTLWRAKRMEWVLSKVWKRLATLHKVTLHSLTVLHFIVKNFKSLDSTNKHRSGPGSARIRICQPDPDPVQRWICPYNRCCGSRSARI
jgi:hypothetical protein